MKFVWNILVKGHFTQLMQELRNVAAEERPAMGARINGMPNSSIRFLNAKKQSGEQAELNAKLRKNVLMWSLPGRKTETGGLHPVTITINRVTKFFSELGFLWKPVQKSKVISTILMH